MITIIIPTGTTKGEVLKIAYKYDADKLNKIDVAIPQTWVDHNPDANLFFYVMDYNRSNIFGEIRHLSEIAEENGIRLIFENSRR